jgi:Uma2 family endonuclease
MEAIADLKTKNISICTERIWKLNIDQYHAMIAAGIIEEDAQLELLEGLLVLKMPKNPPHRISTKLIRAALEKIIPNGWYVDSQEPITLSDSEPEPDVMVIRGQTTDYRDRHPQALDIELVIEVSDATLERDRTMKKRIYANAGIPIYWILNLRERQLEVYTQPKMEESEYVHSQIFTESESINITLKEVGIRTILIKDLL